MNNNVEILRTENGPLTLKIDNKLIHSRFDPIKEAEKLVEPILGYKIYIVFGLGLGYHIKALLKKSNPSLVIVIEDEDLIKIYKEKNPIYDERIKIFGCNEKEKIIEFLESFITIKTISNIKFFYLNSLYSIFFDKYKEIEKYIKMFLDYFFQSIFTEAEFSVLWYRNAINNLININRSSSYHIEGDVAIIGAGPSLKDNLDNIKKLQKNIPIACVDTSLKPLISYGIIPDIVISLDSQVHNYYDFIGIKKDLLKNTILCFDITSYSSIPQYFNKIMIFKTENILTEFFNIFEERLKIPEVLAGGSVSASALSLLYNMGASSIVLIGHDFEYDIITHSISTPSYLKLLFSSNKLFPLHSKFYNIILKRGKRDLFMKNLKKWFEDFISTYKIKLYHIGSTNKLVNAKYTIDNNLKGKIYSFKKIPKDNDFIKLKLKKIHDILDNLRCSENIEDFLKKKNNLDNDMKNLINKILIKQELYLERKNYNPTLFLGGAFGAIDRINKAIKITIGKL
ncbi:MAG TPA: DUF115 domain-containing protein [Spirochaetota bacterium]|nr:DUF115 domain-containing protein [Spirochaetota bacterium]HOM38259.1 DUF115 domain-containing protein [Spirochaetota bacterium]HPQ48523.1 DUF115 domain-containing protein [Spirochaetota bacterium]